MAFRMGTYRQGRTWYYGDRHASYDHFCVSVLFYLLSFFTVAYWLYQEYSYYHHTIGLEELQHRSIQDLPNDVTESKTFLQALLREKDGLVWNRVRYSGEGRYFNDTEEVVEDEKEPLRRGKLGPLLHFNTSYFQASLQDREFSLWFGPKVLQVERVAEYCQWHEHHVDSCSRCTREIQQANGRKIQESYDCHCVRQFHYVKSWSSHRVNSLFFDQPGAHHNPQRDPYPSRRIISRDMTLLNGVKVFPELVAHAKASSQVAKWSHDSEDLLDNFRYSDAFIQDRFIYAGDGYFYSAYEESKTEFFLKKFVQWMEGSILDFQLGDLFPSCTAGDIRIHYQVMNPEVISGIGRLLVDDEKEVEEMGLTTYHANNGVSIAIIRGGNISSKDLILKEESDWKYTLYIARAIVVLWFALWYFCRNYGCLREASPSSTSSEKSFSTTKEKTL